MTRQPHLNAPGIDAGVTETMIRELVHAFYDRVRADPLLGPVFNTVVEDWDVHLEKLCAFWSSVTLMTGRYKGTPMQAHAVLPDVSAAHFERWLELFSATAEDICTPAAARLFADRAGRIADSLQMGMAIQRGEGIVPGRGRHPTAPPPIPTAQT